MEFLNWLQHIEEVLEEENRLDLGEIDAGTWAEKFNRDLSPHDAVREAINPEGPTIHTARNILACESRLLEVRMGRTSIHDPEFARLQAKNEIVDKLMVLLS